MDGTYEGQLDRHLYIEDFIPRRYPEAAPYLIPPEMDPYTWYGEGHGFGIDVRVYTPTDISEKLIVNARKLGDPRNAKSLIVSVLCPDYGRVSHIEHWAWWGLPKGWGSIKSKSGPTVSAIPMIGLPKWPQLLGLIRQVEREAAA